MFWNININKFSYRYICIDKVRHICHQQSILIITVFCTVEYTPIIKLNGILVVYVENNILEN